MQSHIQHDAAGGFRKVSHTKTHRLSLHIGMAKNPTWVSQEFLGRGKVRCVLRVRSALQQKAMAIMLCSELLHQFLPVEPQQLLYMIRKLV